MGLLKKEYNLILKLSEEGESFFEAHQYDYALEKYLEAFDIVPEPKRIYEASSWLLAAIGDCFFHKKAFTNALENFKYSERCEGGLNPFVWLRIGECYVEINEIGNAREYLIRAFAVEGEEIFSEDDKKYLKFISDLI